MTVSEMRKKAANAEVGGFVQAYRDWTFMAEVCERLETIAELLADMKPAPTPKHQRPR